MLALENYYQRQNKSLPEHSPVALQYPSGKWGKITLHAAKLPTLHTDQQTLQQSVESISDLSGLEQSRVIKLICYRYLPVLHS